MPSQKRLLVDVFSNPQRVIQMKVLRRRQKSLSKVGISCGRSSGIFLELANYIEEWRD